MNDPSKPLKFFRSNLIPYRKGKPLAIPNATRPSESVTLRGESVTMNVDCQLVLLVEHQGDLVPLSELG
jgi:hypothetical protein